VFLVVAVTVIIFTGNERTSYVMVLGDWNAERVSCCCCYGYYFYRK